MKTKSDPCKPNKNALVPPYVALSEGCDPAKCEKINAENLKKYQEKLAAKNADQ